MYVIFKGFKVEIIFFICGNIYFIFFVICGYVMCVCICMLIVLIFGEDKFDCMCYEEDELIVCFEWKSYCVFYYFFLVYFVKK